MRQYNQRLQGTILFLSIVLVFALLAVGYTATKVSASGSSAVTYRHGTEEPRETETEHAGATETEHPEAEGTETEHPEATETEHPEAEGTEGPEATETEHPEAEGTEGPEAHETEHAGATETEHPEAEGTEHPEATGTAEREVEPTETEHPERHETEQARATGTVQPTTTAESNRDRSVVPATVPGTGSRTFKETGHSVNGLFLQQWDRNGGVAQQGFPISNVMMERSDLDGKTYAVQYFERAVFEYHPENKPPYDVLLSQLGTFQYKQKYPNGAAKQGENKATGRYFAETGHYVGGAFLQYWQEHGGLAQQGYPISGEFTEVSPLNGKTYTVQYFERAVFEMHPENKPPYNVLLSQLGTFRYQQQQGK
ncbi:MAG: hypothetical protein QOH93_356 [Chloroflexia bacterium]|jgi:hypothetical protein|nr:hypothetical protein [Chloroflexia bacterium]